MFYPHLNENPNGIIKPESWKARTNKSAYPNSYDIESWTDADTIVFSYYGDKMRVAEDDTHYDLAHEYRDDNENYSKVGTGRGKFAGRLFIDHKVISFWEFPKDNKELFKVIADLEKEANLNISDDPGWLIEIPTRYDDWEQRRESGGNSTTFGDVEYVSLRDYKKGVERSPQELASQHGYSPNDPRKIKKDPQIKKGIDIHNAMKRAQVAENFYPKLK